MATGPEHYKRAEKLIAESRTIGADDLTPAQLLDATLREAQVRATLALAAATALQHEQPWFLSASNRDDGSGWAMVAG